MSVESEKKAPEKEKFRTRAEKLKDIPQQDILELSRDERIQEMKDKYGETKDSFVKGIRASDDYGNKVKNMTDAEVMDFANTEKPLKEYLSKQNQSTTEKQKSIKNPESYSKGEQQGSFDQKTYEKIVKEKGGPAGWEYAMNARKQAPKEEEKKEDKKPLEKAPEKKPEAPKEEKKEEKKPEEKIPEKKVDAPKTDNKPAEKPAEPKKEPEKKPEEKKEKKKHFRSARFSKKEKKEEKEKKPGFFGKVGSGIAKGVSSTWHQTGNLFSYPFRTVGSTIAFGWNYMNHGFSKKWREKNQGAYFGKFKWEQGGGK